MHVVERGSGTPLLLLHGFPVDHRILLPLDPVLEQAGGWRRIFLDLPGMGSTPIGRVASTSDVVRAVEAEIAARLGGERFAILGNSFGGMVARAIAHDLRAQVLGIATIVGVVVADHAARDLSARTVLREDALATAIAASADAGGDYTELAVVQSPENAQAFIDSVLPGLRAADPVGVERIAEHYALDREPEDSAPFMAPALFLMGRQDAVVGYRDTWATLEHYPRATFAVLDETGHNAHLEQPGLVGALVADWLRRIRAEGV